MGGRLCATLWEECGIRMKGDDTHRAVADMLTVAVRQMLLRAPTHSTTTSEQATKTQKSSQQLYIKRALLPSSLTKIHALAWFQSTESQR